jgi:NH3-dependent NAD+ synthetase
VARAKLMAILCGSYKTGVTALSKLNLVRKILAHVRQAISHDTPSADLRKG